MKISGAIFDMDGTLLDSMWIYKNYATRYLLSRGVTPRDDLEAAVEKLTLEESAAYLSATYALSGGKPDRAMGGGSDLLKLDDALASVDDFIASKLG